MTDFEDLARRAVASPKWKWLPGVRWRFYVPHHKNIWSRYIGPDAADDDGQLVCEAIPTRRGPAIIDLHDPATLGCLLALIREAWGDPYLCCVGDQETGWRLDGHAAVADLHSYRSEAEALVAALEKAP